MFEKKIEIAKIWTWAVIVFTTVVALFCFYGLGTASETRSQIIYAVVIIVMIVSQALMKLWYWVVNSKWEVLKELKELRLQLMNLQKGN